MSSSMCVIVPSRGRPESIVALREAWAATGAAAHLCVAVDDDDPRAAEYVALGGDIVVGPRLRMAPTLNKVAVEIAKAWEHVGFMGDDHRPRTANWDLEIGIRLDTLGTGIVYGNDLFQKEALPTAVFMTSNIVNALGYMAPPGLIHLYLDNFWLDFGRSLDRLVYLPDVIIEHVHPAAGKAANDAGYVEVNDPAMYAHDAQVYQEYAASGQFNADLEKVRQAMDRQAYDLRLPSRYGRTSGQPSLEISDRWYPR